MFIPSSESQPITSGGISPGMGIGIGAGIQAISGIGQAFLSDHFQSKQANKAWKRQKKLLKNQLSWRVQDAKRAGIHPLAAMGLSPASGPAAGAFVDTSGVSEAGQAIGRSLQSLATREEKTLQKLAILQERERLIKLGLENQGLIHELNLLKNTRVVESDIDRAYNLPGQGDAVNQGAGGVDLVNPQQVRQEKRGYPPGMAPFERRKITKEGKVVWVPMDSQDIEENLIVKGPYYGRRIIEIVQGWYQKHISKDRRVMRRVRQYLPKPRKGYYWRWSAWDSSFYETKGREDKLKKKTQWMERRKIPVR